MIYLVSPVHWLQISAPPPFFCCLCIASKIKEFFYCRIPVAIRPRWRSWELTSWEPKFAIPSLCSQRILSKIIYVILLIAQSPFLILLTNKFTHLYSRCVNVTSNWCYLSELWSAPKKLRVFFCLMSTVGKMYAASV